MVGNIIIYESNHYQNLFPLTRFRAAWDIPTGIFSLNQLLHFLYPDANIFYAPLKGREYLIQNPLSSSAHFEPRCGCRIKKGKLWLEHAKSIKKGETILLIHSSWLERTSLKKISVKPQDEIVSQLDGVPLLGLVRADSVIQKTRWWQDLASGIDPLSTAPLPKQSTLQYPWQILDFLKTNIVQDFSLLKTVNKHSFISPPLPGIMGLRSQLLIHPTVKIMAGVNISTKNGPVVIDQGATLSGPSFIQGPLYIGPGSAIDGAKLRGDLHIGQNCKIAGEVENSLVMDFSNKHHDGFLGHSLVGSWVNFGSQANTSDLKNNYGQIKMWNKGFPEDTGLIKLGSVVADFVKIAIGMQLNTGTVLDTGANVFAAQLSEKYIRGFSWGPGEKSYEIKRFIADTKKIMSRRKQKLSPELEREIRETYKALTIGQPPI